MRRFVLFAVVALLLVASVSAAKYELALQPIDNKILKNESASFQLTVTNFDSRPLRLQLFTVDPNWVLSYTPFTSEIPGKSLLDYNLTLTPTRDLGFGVRATSIRIRNLDTGDLIDRTLYIDFENPDQPRGVYVPSVALTADIPPSVEPGEPLRIDVGLRNRNARDLGSVTLYVDSDLFSQQLAVPLGPLGELTQGLSFPIDEYERPGEYVVHVRVEFENETLNEVTKSFVVKERVRVETTPSGEGGLLTSRNSLFLKNTGNVATHYAARIKTSWFRRFFTTPTPGARLIIEGGERFYEWDVPLEPRETATVATQEDYRLLVVLIVFLILIVLSYYLFRSPIIAVKETLTLEDGELKVRLFIKNRTSRPVQGVVVLDRVPSIAKYVRKESLGALSPTKVVATEKKGTMLKWELDVLEPYEERILSYALKSQLQIVGKMRLPAAKVKYLRAGRERVTFTKTVVVDE